MLNKYMKVNSFHFIGGGRLNVPVHKYNRMLLLFIYLYLLVVTEDHCIPEYRETELLHQFCTDILRVNVHKTVCLYCRFKTSTNSSKLVPYDL